MSLVLDPNNSEIETSNENIQGDGLYAFEANMPSGATWLSGMTITVDIQPPYPGDESQWETLYTFTEKGSWQSYLISGRKYRIVASEKGAWVFLNLLRSRITK